MIRSGDDYRASIRDGREVWMNGERITDVTAHPAFRPLVDARARIYDMAHDPATSDLMSYQDADSGERNAVGLKLPHTREDWEQKRRAVDAVMDDLGGVVIRVGDETVGEMWSLYDGRDAVHVEAQVKYEDGRSGIFAGDLRIENAKTFAPAAAERAA